MSSAMCERGEGEGGEGGGTWMRILMKILEEEVVSSSVMRMQSSTAQEMLSVASRCAKNLRSYTVSGLACLKGRVLQKDLIAQL